MQVSNIAQLLFSRVVDDSKFIDHFVTENRKRLYNSYSILKQTMLELNIPIIEANSGIFMFINLSKYLPVNSFEGERELSRMMKEKYRMIFTPGEACHCLLPGYYRVCYAFYFDINALYECCDRIRKMISELIN